MSTMWSRETRSVCDESLLNRPNHATRGRTGIPNMDRRAQLRRPMGRWQATWACELSQGACGSSTRAQQQSWRWAALEVGIIFHLSASTACGTLRSPPSCAALFWLEGVSHIIRHSFPLRPVPDPSFLVLCLCVVGAVSHTRRCLRKKRTVGVPP